MKTDNNRDKLRLINHFFIFNMLINMLFFIGNAIFINVFYKIVSYFIFN